VNLPGLEWMKQHIAIWSIVTMIFFVAASVPVLRQAVLTPTTAEETASDIVAAAIGYLQVDPGALERMTQNAVRRASVVVDEGREYSAEGSYLLGLQYHRERNGQGAEALYKRSIAQRDDWSWPYIGLGRLLRGYRNVEAEGALRKAIALDPDWSWPHSNLGFFLRAAGRLDEAEAVAQQAMALGPGEITPIICYANVLKVKGLYEEALGQYLKAFALKPTSSRAHYNLACVYSLLGRPEEALPHLAEAIKGVEEFRVDARYDSDFDPIEELPAFRKLLYGE
jgi:tetratricopeptide (TPR) repeat protein